MGMGIPLDHSGTTVVPVAIFKVPRRSVVRGVCGIVVA